MSRLAWVSAVFCAIAVGCGSGAKGGGSTEASSAGGNSNGNGNGNGSGSGSGGSGGSSGSGSGGSSGSGSAGGSGSGSGSSSGGVPVTVDPPKLDGAFTYFSVAQGLSPNVWDVSPDEAGNVYVAAGDAVFAKRREDTEFNRFDAASANLTRNCDATGTTLCNLVSIAGAAPGVAYVGLQGIGTDEDSDPDWELDSGGIDALAFDGTKLTRTRHVEVAGVPHQLCGDHSPPGQCPGDVIWDKGRRKVRQVLRIAVNHDRSKIQYGDVWIAGTHGTFSLLVANPDRRGWVDLTTQFPDFPDIADRRYVWEHDHPAMSIWATINGVRRFAYLTGESTAIAIDPTTGDPWASNETRTASKRGYGSVPDGWNMSMWPPPSTTADPIPSWLDVWPDPDPGAANLDSFDAMDPRWMDGVSSLSFCDDGTLWIASWLHGLARRAPDGTISYVNLPDGLGNSASAVACDPSDGSVWVGFAWGGFGRYDGAWWTVPGTAPTFVHGPVRNIQIDRWASPRIVYVAHVASKLGPGGVTVYDGR